MWVVTAPAPAGVCDGIGDYASRLAAALASTHLTRVVVTSRDPLPALDDIAGVLHQYSPHMQVPGLDRWLRALQARRVPVIVTVHEYWPPASWSPRRVILRWRNRRRLVSLLRIASAVVVTQEIYERELRAAHVCDGTPLHVIPVGSNITRGNTAPMRDGGLVMFGQPASFEREHLVAVAAWLAQGSNRPRLTWIARSREELQHAWRDLAPSSGSPVSLVGGADEAVVSALLSRATLGLAPFANGASGKRTTLAALLQHGVPTVATIGKVSDAWLTASQAVWQVADDDPGAFVEAIDTLLQDDRARAQLSRHAEILYATHMSWPRVAQQYLRVMRDVLDRRGSDTR